MTYLSVFIGVLSGLLINSLWQMIFTRYKCQQHYTAIIYEIRQLNEAVNFRYNSTRQLNLTPLLTPAYDFLISTGLVESMKHLGTIKIFQYYSLLSQVKYWEQIKINYYFEHVIHGEGDIVVKKVKEQIDCHLKELYLQSMEISENIHLKNS